MNDLNQHVVLTFSRDLYQICHRGETSLFLEVSCKPILNTSVLPYATDYYHFCTTLAFSNAFSATV